MRGLATMSSGLGDPHFHIHLGMVPNGERDVTPVPDNLLSLVPRPSDRTVTVKSNGADPIRDTVPLIKQKVKRTLWQTKKLAKALTGSTTEETVRNDWDFIFNHIQYVKDADGIEQVRSPRKLIYDGKGDCDCFTVCLSSLLNNQGINHSLRVTKYETGSEWSHIYIIVPSGSGYITVDPVVHRFNYEVPFTDKKDFSMKLQSLDGFDDGLGSLGCGVQDAAQPDQNAPKEVSQILLQSTKALQQRGLMKGSDFLDQTGLPYQEIEKEGQTVYMVTTPSGIQQVAAWVPSGLSDQQALTAQLMIPASTSNLVAAGPSGSDQSTKSITATAPKDNSLLFKLALAFAGGLVVKSIFTSKPGVNGLGAPGKKKLAVVHI